ncbi:hypothetical protein HYH03_010329 [Edaphochlamys debaryana]|uniref:Thioredoxin domain-containing protein n=1 Tax=Edaphochlamys debaryana TaxID=47281 RepID=A0A835XWX6_9CHLO|nr:hypothetical protein HYH03_010329 [Edaphochlamys debaryana]|eukprot:KAG2491324.1 hypothetical protein HYH03_010329 [Edaphochlamys debaryana]
MCALAMQLSRCRPGAVASRSTRHARRAVVVRAERQEVKVVETVVDAEAPAQLADPVVAASPAIVAPAQSGGNAGLAAGAVAAAVLLFAATRLGGGPAPTLATLEQMSTPLDVALVNGKPTLVEFYANWCEVCRELAPMEYELEKRYQGKVNFVMLNVDNANWAPEAAEFGVRGVPHFVFFDAQGEPVTAAVGRVPREILDGNLQALTRGSELPYTGARGTVSEAPAPGSAPAPRQAAPRDHA